MMAGMLPSRTLHWLGEPPEFSGTINNLLRRGWPGLADFFLLPKLFELGRLARLVERVIFLGGMAGFVIFGGLPLKELGYHAGRVDALELALMVKAIALITGEALQWLLKIVEYFVRGFERLLGFGGE
jgi:hypothetical protein